MNNTNILQFKKLSRYLLSLVFLLLSMLLFAQKTDSLEKVLPLKKDIEKVQLLNELAKAYKANSSNKSYNYANQAFILATSLNNIKEQANSMNIIGVIHYIKGD